MSNNEQKGIPMLLTWMTGFSVIIAMVLISLYFLKFSGYFSQAQEAWGQFGDYVGGILNPLFSLTALFALLHTIQLQSKELHESTEHLKASSEALKTQNEVLTKQQFEATFFQMLALFNAIVKDLQITRDKNNFQGRLAIVKIYSKLKEEYLSNADKNDIKFNNNEPETIGGLGNSAYNKFRYENASLTEAINAEYKLFYDKNNYLLGIYFRTLYSVIKFIDNGSLNNEDKKFYSNIVRAQLSEHELALLFYNCLCLGDYERGKFLPLVKKYDLLEYLDNKFLANPEHRQLLSY